MKIQLFVILVLFQLDISLRTQVLNSGQVAILGVDQFSRECMRFLIMPANDDKVESLQKSASKQGEA